MALLKKVITCVAEGFTFICNKSLEEVMFPDEMKCAKVLPLFKLGAKDILQITTCFTLVSVLYDFRKKYLLKDNFITKYNFINNSQYGFPSNSSTLMALLELTEEITNSLDDQKSTISVFIDITKAFDTLNHGF